MDFVIRAYEERDRAEVITCMEGLQDHITALDPLKRITRLHGYGDVYIEWVLNLLKAKNGVMYVTEKDGAIVGFIAGTIGDRESYEDYARTSSKPYGRIQEMFVSGELRSQGIGAQLIKKLEQYFKSLGCDVMMVEAAAYNKRAHDFYHAHGYENRAIDLLKQL